MRDGERSEIFEEDGGVGGLNVLVYFGGCLFEDQGPEVGDLREELLATGVEGDGQRDLLADWRGFVSRCHNVIVLDLDSGSWPRSVRLRKTSIQSRKLGIA